MHLDLINELEERAECYFDKELIWTKILHRGAKLFLFTEEKYVEQFIKEANSIKERGAFGPLKYVNITFEIQENARYLKIS